jgi:hypothetical protein
MASLGRRVGSAGCTAGDLAAPSATEEVESVGWAGKRRTCPSTISAEYSPESSLGAARRSMRTHGRCAAQSAPQLRGAQRLLELAVEAFHHTIRLGMVCCHQNVLNPQLLAQHSPHCAGELRASV